MRTINHNRNPAAVKLKLLGGTLSLSLLLLPLAMPGLAAYRRPRNARPPSTATSTSGARNGSAIAHNGLQLTLLAPQQHVGQSQSTHPTFEWFVPMESALQGEFQLYEIQESEDVAETGKPAVEFQRVLETPHEFVSEQGFMSFTLPEEIEGLKPNTNYIWQVLLRYGPRPSDIFMVRSQIEIVENTPTLSSNISAVSEASLQTAVRIEQLSEAGLWYDALALAAELPPSEVNFERNTLLLALAAIETADISADSSVEADSAAIDSATAEASESIEETLDETSHSQALRQIADWQNSGASSQPHKFTANLPPT